MGEYLEKRWNRLELDNLEYDMPVMAFFNNHGTLCREILSFLGNGVYADCIHEGNVFKLKAR